jgi:hypothetical protein
MCQQCHRGNTTDRRHFLLRGASALGAAGVLGLFPQRRGAEAAAAGTSGTVDQAHPASATALQQALPAPLPIPGGQSSTSSCRDRRAPPRPLSGSLAGGWTSSPAP